MIKLNYRRFAFSISYFGGTENQNSGANVSSVSWSFTIHTTNGSYDKTGKAYYIVEATDGSYSSGKVYCNIAKNTDTSFSGNTGNFGHNADGSLGAKTFKLTFYETANYKTYTSSYTQYFTTYPRYFSRTPSLSLSSKTNTQFNFSWSTSENASAVYYDLYNSSGGLIASSGNLGTGTSGTFSITGLSGNTTYKVRIRATRSDSGLSSESATGTYATYITPTLSVSLTSRTETSLKIKATPNVAIASKSWTIKNSSGTTVKTSTSTAETVEFTGLSANTTYTVIVSYVSTSANGSLSTSVTTTFTTLQYPYVSAVGTSALTIGGSQTLTLYNPLGRSVTVYMKKDSTSGTQLYSGTTTGTSITFTPDENTLYNTIPNSTSGSAVYYCVYSNVNVGAKTGTYKTKGTELPTFGTSDWSYTADLTSLTNNNQVVIPNYSTVTFTLDNVATANNGASISSYNVVWNDIVALSGTTVGTTASISNKTSSSLSMVAKDSRGYQTTATKTLVSDTTFIPYTSPIIEDISTHRTDGIQAQTTIDMDGKFYVTDFGGSTGSHTNTLYSVKYYTKLTSETNWSTAYDIPVSNFTIDTTRGTFRINDFQIHANGTSGGFTVGTRYDIKVEIKDAKGLLGVVTATSSITDGKIARDVYQDSNGEYHEGINGRADSEYNEKVYGKTWSTGRVLAGSSTTGDYTSINSGGIELFHNSTPYINFHYQNSSSDYTTRLYESTSGTLQNTGNYIVNGCNTAYNGYMGKSLSGGAGTAGYMHACRITTSGSYQNQYIKFIVLQRSRVGEINICFASSATAGALSVSSAKKTGSIAAYYYVSGNTVDLYIQKSEAHDYMEVYILRGSYMSALNIAWQNSTVTSLPSGYVTIAADTFTVPNATNTVVGGIKIRYDSTSKNLYITNNGNNA